MQIGNIFIQRTIKQYRPWRLEPCGKKAKFWTLTKNEESKRFFSNGDEELMVRIRPNEEGVLRVSSRDNTEGYANVLESSECFNFPLKNYPKAREWMQEFHEKLGFKNDIWIHDFLRSQFFDSITTTHGHAFMDEKREYLRVGVHRGWITVKLNSEEVSSSYIDSIMDDDKIVIEFWSDVSATESESSTDSDLEWDLPTEDNMVDYHTPKRKRSDSLDTAPPTPKMVKLNDDLDTIIDTKCV